MRHALFLALVCFIVTACSSLPPAYAPPGHAAQAEDLKTKTVALVRTDLFGTDAYCSGVWVSRNAILTAAHCVRRNEIGDDVAYSAYGDVSEESTLVRTAQLTARDAVHDLALLTAALPPEHGTAATGIGDIKSGDWAQTVGAPLGLWFSYSSGDVAAVRFLNPGTVEFAMWWIQTTAPISGGNSGCGLFDSANMLIGVAHGAYPDGENLNLFVHRDYIEAFLKGAL